MTQENFVFSYKLLGRLQGDCEYYLNFGCRSAKHLWAGNEKEQIEKMFELYESLPEKPVWCTLEQIENYKLQMIGV